MMLGHGKCPKCDHPGTHFEMEKAIVGDQFSGPFFHGVSICCEKCHVVLSVIPDPFSMAADIARRVAEATKKTR